MAKIWWRSAAAGIVTSPPMRTASHFRAKTSPGGQTFETPFGKVMSANITPDLETGIGKWDAEFFRKRFFDYKPYGKRLPETIRPGGA